MTFRDDLDRASDWVDAYLAGELYVAPSTLRGQSIVRLAIGNARTTEADVRRSWEVLRSCAPTR